MEDAKSIIEAVERLSRPDFIGAAYDELALAIVPEGKAVVDLQPHLDALRAAPKRIETIAAVTTVQSLIDYANRFKLGASALFASDDPKRPSLLGIIDFHGGTVGAPAEGETQLAGGDSTPGSNATPRFGRHLVRYDFPVSEQVRAWSEISGKALSQAEMAAFIDERRYDIANPPADWMQLAEKDRPTVELILHLLNIGEDQGEIDDDSPDAEPDAEGEDRYIPRSALYKLRRIRFGSVQRLLQMARTIEITVGQKAREGYDNKTGQRTVMFEEEHQTSNGAGMKVIVPDFFLLNVPVWEGETAQLVPVRLQYRHVKGQFAWFLTLVEWRRVIRFAVRTEAERAREETGLPLFYGARSGGAA